MSRYNQGYNFEISNNSNYKNKRSIPLAIMLKIWLRSALTIMGFILSIFMLPFALVIVPFADIFSTSFNNDDPVVIGIITESNETSAQINSDIVYEYKYQFQSPDSFIYSGTGFMTGYNHKPGDEITISYKEKDPSKSKAVDLRNSLFEGYGAAIFILIFQAVGLSLLYFGAKKAVRRIFILRVGVTANGKLVKKEPDDEEIVENRVYTLTYEYTASDYKTYQLVVTPSLFKLSRLIDEGYEMLVYDPEKPENAVLLDQLPKGIKNFFLSMV